MVQFDIEELKKIAALSSLKLNEEELQVFATQLRGLLGYIDQIRSVSTDQVPESIRPINVLREDIIVPTDSSVLLKQAPETEGSFFVVPKILD